ncbi:flagellar hook protein FlgE [Onishia taeanensis]|uniref:Flagellar hook protein FlgE n=1 Tax=Onishia taeanensis TaxID=284577 RepID=A0A328XYN1_9GAMM|nr:flagellar hook protein FlgE [Halomonas taeanensis]RAR64619.1 flagellar hook protein FlgE [Halomonas taeanensis]
MGFSQALSGLNAAKANLNTLGNNIANSQTVGFKSSTTLFADVFANADVGLGTQVSDVRQDFSDGNIESTSRELDLAISGEGFFRMQQNGETVYSRNGQLTMDADGYLVNAQGAQLMGYGLSDPNDPFSDVVAGGQPEVLRVPAAGMPAQSTTQINAVYNLDAGIVASDPDQLETATVDNDGGTQDIQYHYSNSFTTFDSLGNSRNVTVYYRKLEADPVGPPVVPENTWQANVALDGRINDSTTPGDNTTPGTDDNQFTLEFDSSGALIGVDGAAGDNDTGLTFTQAQLGGAPAAINAQFNLAGTSQFSKDSTNDQLTQNGYTAGTLVGIQIEDDGSIVRNFSNEQSQAAGQIALANFRNPEGLKSAGDNAWTETAASGGELVGQPGTGVLGSVTAGAVETSNVDMASELVDMIVAQRAYQANSQTIKVQDEILQSAVNLR